LTDVDIAMEVTVIPNFQHFEPFAPMQRAEIINIYTAVLPVIQRVLGWPVAPELQLAHIWSAEKGWRVEASYIGYPGPSMNARGEPTPEMALRALACRTRARIRPPNTEEMLELRAALSVFIAAPIRPDGYAYIPYSGNRTLGIYPTFYAAWAFLESRKA